MQEAASIKTVREKFHVTDLNHECWRDLLRTCAPLVEGIKATTVFVYQFVNYNLNRKKVIWSLNKRQKSCSS